MKISELIEMLKELPADADIYVLGEYHYPECYDGCGAMPEPFELEIEEQYDGVFHIDHSAERIQQD